jgi:glycerol uptake facilitator-like aquaporin
MASLKLRSLLLPERLDKFLSRSGNSGRDNRERCQDFQIVKITFIKSISWSQNYGAYHSCKMQSSDVAYYFQWVGLDLGQTAKARHTKFTFLPHSKYGDKSSKSTTYHNGCRHSRSRGLATRRWKAPTKCVAFGLTLCASIAHISLGPQFKSLLYTIPWPSTLCFYCAQFFGPILSATIAHISLGPHFVPPSHIIPRVHNLRLYCTQFLGHVLCASIVHNSLGPHFTSLSYKIPWPHTLSIYRTQFLGPILSATIAHISLGSHFVPLSQKIPWPHTIPWAHALCHHRTNSLGSHFVPLPYTVLWTHILCFSYCIRRWYQQSMSH